MSFKIATIISVYLGDTGEQFSLALDSILNQKINDEVESRIYIAVDGPVLPEIDLVIEARRSSIYHVLYLNKNFGLAAALNRLISILEDEKFIFRMDADDISLDNRYQKQIDYFQLHPDVDILGTDIIEVDERNSIFREVSFAENHDHALRRLCQRVPVAHPTVCFRRRVLDVIGGYPLTGTNEDIAMWFQCANEGFRFGNIHEPLLIFTINASFWRRRSFGKAVSEFRCYVGGIWKLEGVTWTYIFPILRLLMRCGPGSLMRFIYASSFRSK